MAKHNKLLRLCAPYSAQGLNTENGRDEKKEGGGGNGSACNQIFNMFWYVNNAVKDY